MTRTHDSGNEPDNTEEPQDDLLGDLESIKQLLDEAEQARELADEPAGEPEEDSESGVPLLDDMIDGGYKLTETPFLTVSPPLGRNTPSQSSRYLSQDLFNALLGDEWKSSASDILTEARGAIEAHRNRWTPDDTDELNEALRVRIDETLSAWLSNTVRDHMDELHTELLRAAEAAINEKINALIERQPPENSE